MRSSHLVPSTSNFQIILNVNLNFKIYVDENLFKKIIKTPKNILIRFCGSAIEFKNDVLKRSHYIAGAL